MWCALQCHVWWKQWHAQVWMSRLGKDIPAMQTLPCHIPTCNWMELGVPKSYTESPLLALDDHLIKASAAHCHVPQPADAVGELDECDHKPTSPDHQPLLLPCRQGKSRSVAGRCWDMLHQLISLTYCIEELDKAHDALTNFHANLTATLLDMRQHAPQENGILLEPNRKFKRPKPSSPQQQQEPTPLPFAKEMKNKFSGRVGEAASMMKRKWNAPNTTPQKHTPVDKIPYMYIEQQDDDGTEVDNGINSSTDYNESSDININCDNDNSSHRSFNEQNADDVIFISQGYHNVPKHKNRKLGDRERHIISSGAMLTDEGINVAQSILHQQFPWVGGLEDTVLGPDMQFSVAASESVQILHDGGLHWVCMSNIGCKGGSVRYFDSLNSGFINSYLIDQIAHIMKSLEPELTITIEQVQQQGHTNDCGPFAIAFATSLVCGHNPATVNYNQDMLRPHLLQCLEESNISPFPETDSMSKRCGAKTLTVKLYCSCRMPWHRCHRSLADKQMAQCDGCSEWFHQSCENIPDSVFVDDDNSTWKCHQCT